MLDVRMLELRLRARIEAFRPDSELTAVAATFRGRSALEVGGPSRLFRSNGLFPIYGALATLDAANYAGSTLWDASASWDKMLSPASTFVLEAGDLAGIGDDTYDAVLASHVIEHLANPLGALREWARVLRPHGRAVIVAPHRDHTFDHRRPVTPVEHLEADCQADTPESDLTHLAEILELHDLSRDPLAGDHDSFSARSRDNARHRALHHHVFDTRSLVDAVEAAGLHVSHLACRRPHHVIVLAGKDPRASLRRAEREAVLSSSPFPRDRRSP